MSPFRRAAVSVATVLLACAVASGQPAGGPAEKPAATEPVREAAALAFARTHHPELADLLGRLEKADRKAYEKAVRDIAQASERLARLEERDPEQHSLELKSWTLGSRIRLLAARRRMSDDVKLEEELRDLLRQRREVRLEMLRTERRRLLARVEKIDDQIVQIEGAGADGIERELARITREVRRSDAVTSPGKPRDAGGGKDAPKPVKDASKPKPKAASEPRPSADRAETKRGK